MWVRRFMMEQVGLRLFDLAKGMNVRKEYLRLKRMDSMSRDQVLTIQRGKLKQLLEFAYENVPFYRRRFKEASITPVDIHGPHDLALLPPLTRSDIQSSVKEMVATGHDITKGYCGSSSGSTGQPVVYYRDRGGSSMNHAVMMWGWGLSGWRPGMKMLTVWGNPTTVNKDWSTKSSRFKTWLYSESKFPACDLIDDKGFRRLLDRYMKFGPDFMHGYTNAIHSFCVYLKREGIEVPRVKGVLTTAENLQENQMADIETTLGPVFDFYGCGEINGVAYQCNEGTYHLIDPHVVVECSGVKDVEGNEEFLITDLDNFGMPLIRYANGDMGKLDVSAVCPCGVPLAKMSHVSGRLSDAFETPDGGILSVPSFFGSRLLKEISGIERYQVEIVSDVEMEVKLVVRNDFDAIQERLVREALDEYIPDSVKWTLRKVEKIEPAVTGKFKLLVDSRKDG